MQKHTPRVALELTRAVAMAAASSGWKAGPAALPFVQWMQCREWLKTWPPHSFMKRPVAYFRDGCLGDEAKASLNATYLQCGKPEAIESASADITRTVLRRLNHTRLVFLGDSLSFEHFVSTVCFLATPVPELMTSPASLSVRVGDEPDAHYCVRLRLDPGSKATLCFLEWFGKVKHRARPDWISPSYEASISNRTKEALAMMASATWNQPLMRRVVEQWKLGRRDRVVANIGLMFGENPGPLLVRGVTSFVDAYRMLPEQTRFSLLWRETAPQHFSTRGGLYAAGQMNASALQCTSRSAHDGYNALTNPIVARRGGPGVAMLSVWRATDQRFRQRPLEHSPNDCTHYCLPGAALGHWTLALVRNLLSRDSCAAGGLSASSSSSRR